MPETATPVTVTFDPGLLNRIDRLVAERRYATRSQAVQAIIAGYFTHLQQARLAAELAKVDPQQEKTEAEEWFLAEVSEWPEY